MVIYGALSDHNVSYLLPFSWLCVMKQGAVFVQCLDFSVRSLGQLVSFASRTKLRSV